MPCSGPKRQWGMQHAMWLALLLSTGCQMGPRRLVPAADLPHEKNTVVLPTYVIETPDILTLDATRLVPKPPYKVAPLDLLGIEVRGERDPVTNPLADLLPNKPIRGIFSVGGDGRVNLGFDYGTVHLEGKTLEDAKKEIFEYLTKKRIPPLKVKEEDITVVLAESKALQQVRGPHIVKTDGTISLGIYGSVHVDSMTIEEARAAIEKHMSQFLVNPEFSVDVSGFNHEVYYIVIDGAGEGEQVVRIPVTGKSTIFDAISNVGGLPQVASKSLVTLVRPTPPGRGPSEVYPIDWNAIAQRGETETNYQVLPGDRIYLKASPLLTVNTYINRLLAPFERILGATLLFNGAVQTFNQNNLNNRGFWKGHRSRKPRPSGKRGAKRFAVGRGSLEMG